ncbi:histidinol-phosphate transaminase [Garciella nitratireducens]|uniref:Histidinol-phosphate aminotransferase n=1 Tax=Garciella nitratireducens DSM 15102 TaxID=1121911 RepID=A0A1T4PLF6_9FIRM|nr:histidinol-phosphate transaminase [Garciella nitratireducens]SJZ92380.1 histidinol phosphate aminotransferase apoenzyme [Garciella nitratireducens DSM 15102]
MKEIFRNELKKLSPYKPGKPIQDVQKEYGLNKVYKLASNENPLGCSPKVKKALIKCMDNIHLYPDGNATLLKKKISDLTEIPVNRILPSSGLDEMIDLVAKTFINKGDEVIISDNTFIRYMDTTKIMGGVPVVIPLRKDFSFDLEKMLEKINNKTKLIWICNPNNPTGTMISRKELINFVKQVPKDIVIAYDEAYKEFATDKNFPHNSIELLSNHPNIIIMRTLSKAYGLASFRIGYAIASEEIIENLNKVRPAFNVSTFAQAAAIAALDDQAFIQKTIQNNNKGKEYLYKEFDKMNLFYIPTQSNHIWVNIKKNSEEIFKNLQKKGIIIRPMKGTNIRVSIGLPQENEFLVQCLKEELNLCV